MDAPRATFWFEFASSYSYLTLQRAEARAAEAGVALAWRPFLLGPIFAAQGWDTSPFNIYPAKGAFMVRDMERRAAAQGLAFSPPSPFPIHTVAAARQAIAALETPDWADRGPSFCATVSAAYYARGENIAEPAVLASCAARVGLDPQALAARAVELKARLRENTEAAQALGIFGAPSVTVAPTGDGDRSAVELFWGDDQFDAALAWAKTGRLPPR